MTALGAPIQQLRALEMSVSTAPLVPKALPTRSNPPSEWAGSFSVHVIIIGIFLSSPPNLPPVLPVQEPNHEGFQTTSLHPCQVSLSLSLSLSLTRACFCRALPFSAAHMVIIKSERIPSEWITTRAHCDCVIRDRRPNLDAVTRGFFWCKEM